MSLSIRMYTALIKEPEDSIKLIFFHNNAKVIDALMARNLIEKAWPGKKGKGCYYILNSFGMLLRRDLKRMSRFTTEILLTKSR